MAVFMRAGFWVAVFLAVGHSFAQTDVKSFERSWKGKQLVLRSYSGDEVAHYDWQDGKLMAQVPLVHTLAIFEIGSVKRKGDTIVLDGSRFTLMRKDEKLVGSAEVSMELEVTLHGADPAFALPALAAGLFFGSVGDAVAGVPPQFQGCTPWQINRSTKPNKLPAWIERNGAWTGIGPDEPKLQVPQVKFAPEPRYSEEALRQRVSGTVGVCFVVDDSGKPMDLWLSAPVRAGLDEAALEAVRHYIFAPAHFNGEPVATSMAVGVTFQTF